MTTNNKTQAIAEKIKAFALGFIGSLFFALGLTYFSEKSYYQVPRILLPVYDYFRNIGLAVGLLVLGGGLMFWAYKKFKNYGGKPMIMITVLPLFIIASFGIAKLTEKTYKPNFEKNTSNKQTVEPVADETANTQRPKLDNPKANDYLEKLEDLLQKMTKAKEIGDRTAFDKLDEQYLELIENSGDIFSEMSKTAQYREFAMYNAKVSKEINKLRGI